MKTYRDRMIVLRAYALGEADRIIVGLGRNSGQIRAVAKGVRKPTSRFGARLAPGNLVEAQLYRGRNLDTVTQVELTSGYGHHLAADYRAFTSAKVMLEATQKLTENHDDSDGESFTLLHGALAALSSGRLPADLVAASFLLRLMRGEGWSPHISQCATCGRTQTMRVFSSSQGGFVCAQCPHDDGAAYSSQTQELVGRLMEGEWEQVDTLDSATRADALSVASRWTEWNLEQKLRSIEHLRAEQ